MVKRRHLLLQFSPVRIHCKFCWANHLYSIDLSFLVFTLFPGLVIDPGDEVILFEPTYETYGGCISLAGGVPVRFLNLSRDYWCIILIYWRSISPVLYFGTCVDVTGICGTRPSSLDSGCWKALEVGHKPNQSCCAEQVRLQLFWHAALPISLQYSCLGDGIGHCNKLSEQYVWSRFSQFSQVIHLIP